jgi:hypothetical protein
MLQVIENLRQVARHLSERETLPEPLAQWLASSLGEFLGHRRASLEEAFGLRSARGGVPWWLEEAMRQRDAALRQLAVRFYPSSSPTARAHAIHTRALRYAASAWSRDRSQDAMPPDYVGRENECLWRAFKSGAPMPIGERRMRHILGR